MEFPRVLAALTNDVAARLAVNPKRVYLAGMSGGARTALGVALASKEIAGVIASSAGYPDSNIRKTLSFPLFATAGTDDFNHLEMRKLDRALTTPHRLVIFNGGHVWLSSELAMQAIEWMELHAMKAGLKPRDEAEIDRLLASRMAAVGTGSDKETFRALQAIADDFDGLRDVSAQMPASSRAWTRQGRSRGAGQRSATKISARKRSFVKWRLWQPVSRRMSGSPVLNRLRQTMDGAVGSRRRIQLTRRSVSWLGGCSRR